MLSVIPWLIAAASIVTFYVCGMIAEEWGTSRRLERVAILSFVSFLVCTAAATLILTLQ